MKKVFLILCCLSLLFLLSGCWDLQELNEVSLITGMALDKGEKMKYKLTVESLNPAELNPQQQQGNAPSVVYSMEGDTIAEISRRLNIGLSKRLVYSHMRTIVIDEKVAREGLLEFFDYLERYREIREDFNVVIAKGVQASDILKTTYSIQKVSTLKLHKQLDNAYEDWGADPDIRKKDMIDAWTSEGRHPVTAAVSISGNPKKGNSMDNIKKIKPDALVVLEGMTIFKGQKLIGFLDVNDTRNYLWTQNKLKITSLSIPCKKNKFITIRVFRTRTVIKANHRNYVPHIEVNIDVESQIDVEQCGEDLSKLKTYQDLERKIENYIEKEVSGTIQKVQQKYKVDIFGFGEDMKRQDYRNYQKVMKNWDAEFTRADIKVNTLVTLRRAGIRTKSFLSEIK
jgi:spore germination protein KC